MPSLYVTEQGATVETEAGQLLVTRGGEVLFAAPAARVSQVVLVGRIGVTTPALHRCLDAGTDVVLLGFDGGFRGRLSGQPGKNIPLRRAQYRRADDPAFCLGVARAIVTGKIRNARTLLLRLDESNDDPVLLRAARELATAIAAAAAADDPETLRGIEGQAGRSYFAAVRTRIEPPWVFARRARRPPPDPVNCLFSVVYTLLHESCYAALEAAGLDPFCGLFHAERHGRASLAQDLMEPFRPVIADSVVMTLLNWRMIEEKHFESGPNGAVHLTREGWRLVAEQFGSRLRTLVRPEGLSRAVSYQKVLEREARRLARVIEGEPDAYEPFLIK